jgi:hypothetical protein
MRKKEKYQVIKHIGLSGKIFTVCISSNDLEKVKKYFDDLKEPGIYRLYDGTKYTEKVVKDESKK